MQKQLNDLSDIEIKAFVYDANQKIIEQNQIIKFLQQELLNRSQAQPQEPTITETKPEPEELEVTETK